MHERVDTRIQAQKDERWKGSGTWKGKIGKMEDPRPSGIIPIHAPKMERMTKARLQALKQRAMTAEASRKEGIVDGIMYEMEKLHNINYSMTTIGAEIVTEAEMLPAQNVVPATNDPNTIRPRPPKMKFSREQKVLPFPKRRRQALQQEQQGNSRLSDSSDACSDASWPTDKDEEIATFSKRKTLAKRKTPINRKPQGKASTKTSKAKRVTKIDINNMLQCLQKPVAITPSAASQASNRLDQSTVRALIRAQQARIRQRTYRARVAARKKAKTNSYAGTNDEQPITQQTNDVLAQAITLSNILNSEENEALDEILHSQALDSDDNEALDELITELANEEETRQSQQLRYSPTSPELSSSSASSSSSDSNSSTSSSSNSESGEENDANSDDDGNWGNNKVLVRNPFAAPAKPKAVNTPHAGYFTENGLKQQRQKISALKRRAGLDSRSVSIVKLDRKEVEKYLNRYSTPITPNNNDEADIIMSAKNISKDRSSSRGRSDKPKPDRFNKGREQQGDGEERMDDEQNSGHNEGSEQQKGQGAGEQNKGSNKRSREPPRTGNHDNTTTEDSDEEMPNAKRATQSLREKLTQVYQKKTKETRTSTMKNASSHLWSSGSTPHMLGRRSRTPQYLFSRPHHSRMPLRFH